MSRSGYSDDYDTNLVNLWRANVDRALRGGRGQAFLRELLATLDAMPEKRLIAEELIVEGEVCAMGAVGARRGLEMEGVDPEDTRRVGKMFEIAPAMAAELFYVNDEAGPYSEEETSEQRFWRVRRWVVEQIKDETK